MSKRLKDLQNANLYLFNMLFRHQVYLEGLKGGVKSPFGRMLHELYGEFAKYFMMVKYTQMDDFTRVELQHFIRRFQEVQRRYFNQYTNNFVSLLRDFLDVDVSMGIDIMNDINLRSDSRPADLKSDDMESLHFINQLWATIRGDIVPASGLTFPQMLNSFTDNSIARVSNLLSIGYANNLSMRDTLHSIVGTPDSNFRDGVFATFINQNAALTGVILQHVSSNAQSAIASQNYDTYQWVSVMDSKTTSICRERNGQVYSYADGPHPPAHYGCRSKEVPLAEGDASHDIPSSFVDWANTQPNDFLRDAFGSAEGVSEDSVPTPLTLTKFREKINLITM